MEKPIVQPESNNGSGSDTDEQVERLLRAYKVGRTIAVKWDVESDRQEWAAPLRYSTMTHLRRSERDTLCKNKIHCVRARDAVSALDFGSACREVAIARSLRANAELCKEAGLLADSEILAVEATIEFRCRNYPQSRQKLLANSIIDQTLEDDVGLGCLHAHRIHLLSKHVQLTSFAEGPIHALRIGANAISYLHGGSLDLSAAGDWSQSRVQKLPLGIRRFLVRQLAVEVGAALLYANEEVTRTAVQEFCSIIPLKQFDRIVDPMSRYYLRALRLKGLPNHDVEHISAAADLLNFGAQGAETLWFMCALDGSESCSPIDSDAARCLRQLVLEQASQHTAFPLDLRRRWFQQGREISNCAAPLLHDN
jgi:hypothetical protein